MLEKRSIKSKFSKYTSVSEIVYAQLASGLGWLSSYGHVKVKPHSAESKFAF